MLPAPALCIVVPSYNEEEALPSTAKALRVILEEMAADNLIDPKNSYICFVNDGSRDRTWEIIEGLMAQSPVWRGINLSRNFGHQGALLAGLFTAEADAYVSIDADLQDDERKIIDMVRLYREGNDIVYGCRDNRDTDTWFKRTTAGLYYRLRADMGCYTVPNHADYRLMSARAVRELKRFGEVNLYLRGIVPMLGFPSAKVTYARKSRQQGESKYPLPKMVALAWNGVVNFSETPLIAMVWAGLLGILGCMAFIFWSLWRWHIGATLPGWTSTVLIVAIFSSLQFLFTGIIGLYIGKIFRETKHRPLFIIKDDYSKART